MNAIEDAGAGTETSWKALSVSWSASQRFVA